MAIFVAVATGATLLASGQVRWRLEVIDMKAKGQLPAFGWGELLWDLRPGSPLYLKQLTTIPNPDLAIENPYFFAKDSIAGADAFQRACASCHGMDAQGGANAPSLAATNPLRRRSDFALYRSIARGIPGTALRPQALPSQTIWQIVAYLQSLRVADSVTPLGPALTVPVSKLLAAAADSSGWYMYSGDYYSHRYSRLSAINTRNVRDLRVAWVYQSGAAQTTLETSPLVSADALYFTEPPANVVALAAADGRLRWRYSRDPPDGVMLCCGQVNRGVAILDSLLFLGTPDAHLVALNARNGRLIWDRQVADWQSGYSITSAPLAIRASVITGVAGGEYGTRGFIASFDAVSGQRRWQFWTVPAPGEAGSDTWTGDAWKRGGGPTWLTGSFDPALNLVYWGVGNPAPNFNGDERAGDNLYTNSVVALDADSGRLRWHFQFSPHDEHDWDAAQIPILIDARYKGVQRPLIAWANRNAFFYLLDRRTGEFLLARPFARENWTTGIDSNGRPQVQPSSRTSPQGTLVYPGVAGATNWWSPSFSPRTGLLYVPVLEETSVIFREPARYQRGETFMGGASQYLREAQTLVRAIDPLTGAIKWEHTLAARTDWHRIGGILSVAGDLLFVGQESVFYALDARTGEELWRFNTGGRITAAPITYVAHGRQYVAIACGRALMAFALDGDARGPRVRPR